MMNKIYDFSEIEKIQLRQRRLILCYALYVLCFLFIVAIACLSVKNNILLTVIFAFLLLVFLLFSISFWRIKYGVLNEYRLFLDNMETGSREDYIGEFIDVQSADGVDEPFDRYTFASFGRKTFFLIHKQNKVLFSKGKKYHVEYVGNYIYQWESAE